MSAYTGKTCRKSVTGPGPMARLRTPPIRRATPNDRFERRSQRFPIMSDAILVLNSGSSSIKFGLFDISRAEPVLLCKGLLDEHDAAPRFAVTDASGNSLF